ncbi:MAG: hypothetical protein CMF38_00145 [Legionellaceae bacterium]|nr:hypothetical protein [Legionellaceae bacterium]HAF88027.1 hypothetical protein [Legionellales bacterium]HCA88935.1 hypothetical protein [Legionellales bacterium]|tara:strand:+ start:1232 stop:1750 length:519 start_codon:yes stop_codon:yes gene_type:complete
MFNRNRIFSHPLKSSQNSLEFILRRELPISNLKNVKTNKKDQEYQDTFYDPIRHVCGYTLSQEVAPVCQIIRVSFEEQDCLHEMLQAYENAYIFDEHTQTLFYNRHHIIETVKLDNKTQFMHYFDQIMNIDHLVYKTRFLSAATLQTLITDNTDHCPKNDSTNTSRIANRLS